MWKIKTDQGTEYEANFVVSAPGPLHKPSIPKFKGRLDPVCPGVWLIYSICHLITEFIIISFKFLDIDSFDGPIFHTSMWRKDIDLTGKRVGIVGTGATSVQIVPEIAEKVKELYVFQRTAAWSPPKSLFDYPTWIKVRAIDMGLQYL